MKFHDIGTAPPLVQAVHILSNDHLYDTELLELTQRKMRFVGIDSFDKSAHLHKHFPYLRRIGAERIYMPVFKRVVFGPESVLTPEIRYSALHRYPGAGQSYSIAALQKQIRESLVLIHISPE
jgi:hypothetical protein